MIRLTDTLPPLSPAALPGLRLLGLYAAYGPGRDFLPFWRDDRGGAGARLGDTAVCIPGDGRQEEWAAFLAMQPEVRQAVTDLDAAAALREAGFAETVRPLLRLPAGLTPDGETGTPSLRDIYPLLTAVFGAEALPPFASWYTDMSHRLRHGCGRAVCVTEEEKPVSCALVTAECAAAGLIGGVATLPAFRGRGFARRTIAALTQALSADGKAAYICPKNEKADALYRRFGAVEVSRYAFLTR